MLIDSVMILTFSCKVWKANDRKEITTYICNDCYQASKIPRLLSAVGNLSVCEE